MCVGQSVSALPRHFRRQPVQLSRGSIDFDAEMVATNKGEADLPSNRQPAGRAAIALPHQNRKHGQTRGWQVAVSRQPEHLPVIVRLGLGHADVVSDCYGETLGMSVVEITVT